VVKYWFVLGTTHASCLCLYTFLPRRRADFLSSTSPKREHPRKSERPPSTRRHPLGVGAATKLRQACHASSFSTRFPQKMSTSRCQSIGCISWYRAGRRALELSVVVGHRSASAGRLEPIARLDWLPAVVSCVRGPLRTHPTGKLTAVTRLLVRCLNATVPRCLVAFFSLAHCQDLVKVSSHRTPDEFLATQDAR
jgi:hypothetical protein